MTGPAGKPTTDAPDASAQDEAARAATHWDTEALRAGAARTSTFGKRGAPWRSWEAALCPEFSPGLAEGSSGATIADNMHSPLDGAAMAFGRLSRHDPAAGVLLARRAARMTQGDSISTSRQLTHLILARARRHVDRPHVCLRICDLLLKEDRKESAGWLAWESMLAGGAPDLNLLRALANPPKPVQACLALALALAAVRSQNHSAFNSAADALMAATHGVSGIFEETSHLLCLLDPLRPATPEISAWRDGQRALPPCGLRAICAAADDTREGGWAYVLAAPGLKGRRTARFALRDTAELPAPAPGQLAPSADPAHVRTATALAALALAGAQGCDISEFWKLVYGFPYKVRLHQQTIDGLIYRVRQTLDGAGTIDRGDHRVVLTLHAPLMVPDPRCAESTDDLLMRALSHGSALTAKELADTLNMPLRTVQAGLQALVSDEACAPVRSGRNICYHLTDTTLAPPNP